MIRPTDLGRFLDAADPDTQVLYADQVWRTVSTPGGGTVTSVGLSAPSAEFTVGGSPVTTSGTLALTWKNQNSTEFFAGPVSGPAGTPGFRVIEVTDLAGTPGAGKYWDGGTGTWTTLPAPGTGTVTSVDVAVPTELLSSGGPITTSGTITLSWVNESSNLVFAGPNTGPPGTPAFRSLVNADLPDTAITPGSYTYASVTFNQKGVATAAASGTAPVTSVGLAAPVEFNVSGSPVTSTGTLTLAWANETANRIFAGPSSGPPGTPTFRAMVAADIPNTAVTPGSYTYTSLTVDAQGRLTAASSGAAPTGTVTSVAMTVPTELSVSGSPITTSGTLALSWNSEAQHSVFAGPSGSAGTPAFRALVASDIPALSYVTSVGLSLPAEFTVSNSPVTSSGTLTAVWATKSANTFFAGPTSGGAATPAFRTQVAEDVGTGTPTSGYLLQAAGAGVKPAWASIILPPPANASITLFNFQNFV